MVSPTLAQRGDGGMPPRLLGVDFVVPVWGPGYGGTWRWEFRGLRPRCRSEDRRSYSLWYAARRTDMAMGVSRPLAAMPV